MAGSAVVGAVSRSGIAGAWKIGDDGLPTGEYKANERYGGSRSSPADLACPWQMRAFSSTALLHSYVGWLFAGRFRAGCYRPRGHRAFGLPAVSDAQVVRI